MRLEAIEIFLFEPVEFISGNDKISIFLLYWYYITNNFFILSNLNILTLSIIKLNIIYLIFGSSALIILIKDAVNNHHKLPGC